MTEQLSKAFKEASKLSRRKQSLLAKQLLIDIKNDKDWEKEFKDSQIQLEQLAGKALKESSSQKTKKTGFDKL